MRQVNENGWEEPGIVTAVQSALARCDWSTQAPATLRRWLGAQLLRHHDDATSDREGPEDRDL